MGLGEQWLRNRGKMHPISSLFSPTSCYRYCCLCLLLYFPHSYGSFAYKWCAVRHLHCSGVIHKCNYISSEPTWFWEYSGTYPSLLMNSKSFTKSRKMANISIQILAICERHIEQRKVALCCSELLFSTQLFALFCITLNSMATHGGTWYFRSQFSRSLR